MIEELLRQILVALIVILVIFIVKHFFFPDKVEPHFPLPPQEPKRRLMMTKEQLSPFRGENGAKIYLAIKDKIFDVSHAKSFYGPGASYHGLTGRDATMGLAKMDPSSDFSDLTMADLQDEEKETLNDWYERFLGKYDVVGILVHGDKDKEEKEKEEELRMAKEMELWKDKLVDHARRVEEIKKRYLATK